MFRTRLKTALLLLGPALLLAYGLHALFSLRFEMGDMYPAYSSFRADPLGTEILYESLRELPALTAQRNLGRLDRLQPDESTTILFLGMGPHGLPPRLVKRVSELVGAGARVVVSFSHAGPSWRDWTEEERAKDEEGGGGPTNRLDRGEETGSNVVEYVRSPWGVALQFAHRKRRSDEKPIPAEPLESESVYGPVTWASSLYFTIATNEAAAQTNGWKALYERNGKPVLIERAWGKGVLVLVGDSYFLSNEALLQERHSALLSRLIGSPRLVLFDETHLGIREQPGLMNLAWKYRLHGVAAVLVLLAALFLWRSFARWLPAPDGPPDGETVIAGMDSHEGYLQLLRRSFSAGRMPRICLEEWMKTSGHDPRLQRKAERMREVLARFEGSKQEAAEAVKAYQTMSNIAKERD